MARNADCTRRASRARLLPFATRHEWRQTFSALGQLALPPRDTRIPLSLFSEPLGSVVFSMAVPSGAIYIYGALRRKFWRVRQNIKERQVWIR
eukprot:6196359-Pleurochrysis_carterae.AAC.2